MKHTTRTFLLIAAAIATVTVAASGQSKDEAAVRAASMAFQSYVAKQQVDSIVALHLPNATVMMANSQPVIGSNGIRSGWGDVVKLPNLSMHWTPERIRVVSPTVAQEYGTYADSFDGPNGKESDAGTYLTIWNKVNGRWRIAYDVPVSSQPPKPAMPAEPADFVARSASSIAWGDFAAPGFAPGAKIAVMHGDPSKSGRFVLRLSFPDGYSVPLHWHPTAEYVTVIQGGASFGMGNAVDASATTNYSQGDFVFIPAKHAHWLTARGATVVQVSGSGPFQLNLGAPK